MKILAPWIDRHLGLLILAGGTLALAMVAVSALDDERADADYLRRIVLSWEGHEAVISLNKGSDKPLLRTSDERPIVDVSGWESVLEVNGESRVLYRHTYNVASDGRVAYVTWSDPEYALEERIEATAEGLRIAWSWLRAPEAPHQEVNLTVAHFSYHIVEGTARDGVVRYLLAAEDPRGFGTKPVSDDRPLSVTAVFDPVPHLVRFDHDAAGVDSYRATYRFNATIPGTVTPIFTETLSWSRVPGPLPTPAPPPALTPPDRVLAEGLDLEAGPYHVTVGLNRGSDKPRLASPEGRRLLDLSAWESTLRVNGLETSLYRLPYEVIESTDGVTINWRHPDYRLEERISVSSQGLAIAWAWVREPGAPAHDVELHLAHFASVISEFTEAPTGVRYRLEPEPSEPDARPYEVDVRLSDPPTRVWVGESPEGIDAFRLVYGVSDPPAGERVPLFTETVAFSRVDP